MLDLSLQLFSNNYVLSERLLVFAFSLIPTLAIIFFVLYADKKSKEPLKNIIICLLSGIITISLSRYLEQMIVSSFSGSVFLIYFNAFIEELFKIGIFFIFIFDNKYYDDIFDGIVYMALIALSFAGLENLLYAFSENTLNNSISLTIMRDFTVIPLHVICGIIMGHFLSLSNFSKKNNNKAKCFLVGIGLVTLIHGTFNLIITLLSKLTFKDIMFKILIVSIILAVIMILLYLLLLKIVKKTIMLNDKYINNQKYDEQYSFLMTYDQFICSGFRRNKMRNYHLRQKDKFVIDQEEPKKAPVIEEALIEKNVSIEETSIKEEQPVEENSVIEFQQDVETETKVEEKPIIEEEMIVLESSPIEEAVISQEKSPQESITEEEDII